MSTKRDQTYEETKTSIQRSVTCRINIYQVCRGFTRHLECQQGKSFFRQAWNESQWTVLLSKMLAAIKHIAAEIILFFFTKTAHHCIVHGTHAAKNPNLIASELLPQQSSAKPR